MSASALDIGEIQVQSALNQLFDARIPLPTLTPEELAKVYGQAGAAADV
jgi:Tfp pilus assembly protein FimV